MENCKERKQETEKKGMSIKAELLHNITMYYK